MPLHLRVGNSGFSLSLDFQSWRCVSENMKTWRLQSAVEGKFVEMYEIDIFLHLQN